VLCVVRFPTPYTEFSYIALWAVITSDLLYEANIGLSISKGFNRVLGTLAAGFLGFGLNQIGPEFGPGYPYFVVNITACFFMVLEFGVFVWSAFVNNCRNAEESLSIEWLCAGFLCNDGRHRF
jgi:hypothetical protein